MNFIERNRFRMYTRIALVVRSRKTRPRETIPRFPAEQFSAGGNGRQDFTARFAKILRGRISLESPRLIQLFHWSRASRNYIVVENDDSRIFSLFLSLFSRLRRESCRGTRGGLGLIICGWLYPLRGLMPPGLVSPDAIFCETVELPIKYSGELV